MPSLMTTRWSASPDPASKSAETDRLVGSSPAVRMVIVVISLREALIG